MSVLKLSTILKLAVAAFLLKSAGLYAYELALGYRSGSVVDGDFTDPAFTFLAVILAFLILERLKII